MGLVVNQRGRSKYKCSAYYHGTCSKSETKKVGTSVLLIIMGLVVNQRGRSKYKCSAHYHGTCSKSEREK